MPLRRVNDVKQVEPGARAGNTAADTGTAHDNSARTAEARDIVTLRREMELRDKPAGPPPSFEVSQLEIESDLHRVIARVEAARNQAREADALKVEAQTDERQAEAEMARLTEAGEAKPAETDRGVEAPEASVAAPPRPVAGATLNAQV